MSINGLTTTVLANSAAPYDTFIMGLNGERGDGARCTLGRPCSLQITGIGVSSENKVRGESARALAGTIQFLQVAFTGAPGWISFGCTSGFKQVLDTFYRISYFLVVRNPLSVLF